MSGASIEYDFSGLQQALDYINRLGSPDRH